MYAPFLLALTYSANLFALKTKQAVVTASVLFVLGWVAQFIGHGYFERRAPALFENIKGILLPHLCHAALLLAPLFVFMEILFALGYRPALKKRIHEKVKSAIIAWKHGSRTRLAEGSSTGGKRE